MMSKDEFEKRIDKQLDEPSRLVLTAEKGIVFIGKAPADTFLSDDEAVAQAKGFQLENEAEQVTFLHLFLRMSPPAGLWPQKLSMQGMTCGGQHDVMFFHYGPKVVLGWVPAAWCEDRPHEGDWQFLEILPERRRAMIAFSTLGMEPAWNLRIREDQPSEAETEGV